MAKIDIILSSINNIFKKINLLNNIDKYIINKKMTGGMISNYDVDNDYNGNGNGDVVDYDVDYDVSDYDDGDYDSEHKKLMDSILLNKDLIDQLSELIIKLNKDPKYTNIVKLIDNYNIIIAQLEEYTSYYAKMAAHVLRDNARQKIRTINSLKSNVNTNIRELFKETQPRLLLTLHNDQYNSGNGQYKRIEHPQPFKIYSNNNKLVTDVTKHDYHTTPIIQEIDEKQLKK